MALLPAAVLAQRRAAPYAAVDARALRVRGSSAESLARQLTAPYKNDTLKARAIFRWVTANIAYDVYGYHDTASIYSNLYLRNGYPTDSAAEQAYTRRMGDYILRQRKGICEGYAQLFKALCDAAGLPCKVISGTSRHPGCRIGRRDGELHAWNAVLLGGRWELIDATWGSGYSDSAVLRFTRRFDPSWFLQSPRQFANSHHPDLPGWMLLAAAPDRAQFFFPPFFYDRFYRGGICGYSPLPGDLQADKNGTVHFELETGLPPRCLQVEEYPELPPAAADSEQVVRGRETLDEALSIDRPCESLEGNRILLDYRVKSARTRRLDLYLDGELVMSYGLSGKR